MAEVYICTSCSSTEGQDDGNDYCHRCGSSKYFAWVEENEDV
jgi:hypothetical protein